MKLDINEIKESINAKRLTKGFNWNGYEVYEPDFGFGDGAKVGFPLVVLIKGEEARMSTNEESLDYLEYSNKMKNQQQNELKNKFEQ